MEASRVLFTSHSRVVSGAEIVLTEVVKPWAGASAFVFEKGPLQEVLARLDLSVTTSRFARGIAKVKRDNSLFRVIPLVGRLFGITVEIARAARRHDVVYANSQKAFVLAAIATTFTRQPLIWHLHDIPDREHFGKSQLRLQIALANARARRVIVPSNAVAEGFVKAGGKRDLVVVVPNGVVPPEKDLGSKQEIRQQLGLPSGHLVGVFSRLAPWKGQHVLIEAMARLPDANCIIVGSALFGEDGYADRLADLVSKLGLEKRIIFLGQRHDINRLMRAVDVVVHPSTSPEPFGLTVVESMFAGTPVVATSLGAVPEILDNGDTGSLVAPNDVADMTAAIAFILAAPPEIEQRTEKARGVARIRYSADLMASRIAKIIREVAKEAKR